MATANEPGRATEPRPLVVSRHFGAARELVFSAWSSADYLKNWFCPAGFSVPQAEVEFRVGGRFDICMRAPDGQEHWTRGHYVEIAPANRLVIEMDVVDSNGEPLLRADTAVNFADQDSGTRIEVTQTYTLYAAQAETMVQGASTGWEQTLDRLARELERLRQAAPHCVVHGSFRIERTYAAPLDIVFQALTEPAAKAKWFGGGQGYTVLERAMDARPGGRERLKGRWDSGVVSTFDAVYFDVIPNERIVYAYEMRLDERKISVSLATFELLRDGAGTRLVLTENGAFLDGYDDAGSRERGTQFLLDALGQSIQDMSSA
jgi:uncharacterized protein YndB with AHSA1/START domain